VPRAALILLGAALVLPAGPAPAQALRCESPDGKVSYASERCPPGTTLARELPAAAPASEADRKRAQAQQKADAQRLDKIEQQRRKDEDKAQRERAAAAHKAQERERSCRKLASRLQDAEDRLSRSTVDKRPAAEKARNRAREQYELDCR
jgi:hypothetical protein